jgi:hypothetical protein
MALDGRSALDKSLYLKELIAATAERVLGVRVRRMNVRSPPARFRTRRSRAPRKTKPAIKKV